MVRQRIMGHLAIVSSTVQISTTLWTTIQSHMDITGAVIIIGKLYYFAVHQA